ncbi:MAG: glycosyltransferase family 2 protein [Clostridiales bacterium]|nr:glycosyltransferase family 2 protein [Clostridiales bacterium]
MKIQLTVEFLRYVNYFLTMLFALSYACQFVYIPISLFETFKNWVTKKKRAKTPEGPVPFKSYAFLICARNEELVIGNLIDSINHQNYPYKKIKVFVCADHCDDKTAEISKTRGAVVYERYDDKKIGKGYALDFLLKKIREDYPAGFDGYFVFDADNVIDSEYVSEMNKIHCKGHDIITCYRNSKNYGDSWTSAGNALWFLREAQYLNRPRYFLHTSCGVSGTGFMFSRRIAEKMNGYPFHLLTEDIEFTIDNIVNGEKIAYAEKAIIYDEQPIKFVQSWRQRMRWSRGGIQVFVRYGPKLVKGIFHGSFSCYDMTMSVMPAFFLSTAMVLLNILMSIVTAVVGDNILLAFESLGETIVYGYTSLFVIGLITVITEWKNIRSPNYKKLLYTFTFPIFVFTYLPIAVSSLFVSVKWKPIVHTVTTTAEDLANDEHFDTKPS